MPAPAMRCTNPPTSPGSLPPCTNTSSKPCCLRAPSPPAKIAAPTFAGPDLGRRLSPESATRLAALPATTPDLAIVIADGLSALAIDRHALPMLEALLPLLSSANWTLATICLVQNGRVAIADEIASLERARLSLILIGERPGLSSPDSLGAYLTFDPCPGRTDADRNCISNIRDEGLGYPEAAHRIIAYLEAAKALGRSGYALKQPPSPNLPAIG